MRFKEGCLMDIERNYKLARGYSFLARNMLGGKVVNAALEALAFMDYRMLIILSMWHPDHDTRIKLLRKRGVQVGEHVFLEQGAWVEITAPQSVVLEDYTAVTHGAIILAHDATPNRVGDLPMRLKETRLKYGSGVGMNSIVMPGVTFGEYAHALPGSVVTKDVPDGMIVAGNPAEVVFSNEDVCKGWQADMKRHPERFFDLPDNPWRPPSTPYDHLITWREDGVEVRQSTELRTGTPFDYILDAKASKEKER
jgi:acetyltransferase-like isoleucine patch superfamily enzyme